MKRRIAVFGGSCNPFAKHHQEIIRWLVEEAQFSSVIVVPAVAHAFKRDLLPFEHRYNMAVLGVEDLKQELPNKDIQVSMLEVDLLRGQPTPVRTYEVLCALQRVNNDFEIRFAIGPDIVEELPRWENVSKIESEFGFAHIPRHIPRHPMRSTAIRDMIAANNTGWAALVSDSVGAYIDRHGLYRSKSLF